MKDKETFPTSFVIDPRTMVLRAIRGGTPSPTEPIESVRVEKRLRGILGTVADWRIVDSTTIKLDDELIAEWPGTLDYAALKVHKE